MRFVRGYDDRRVYVNADHVVAITVEREAPSGHNVAVVAWVRGLGQLEAGNRWVVDSDYDGAPLVVFRGDAEQADIWLRDVFGELQ